MKALPLLLALTFAVAQPPPMSAQAVRPATQCCPVIELRQYTIHPDKRADLVALYDTHFAKGQEDHGIHALGQFIDTQNPSRFVWIRGFTSLEQRATSIDAFYSSSVWKTHAAAANRTMIDYRNVLLLRPVAASLPVMPMPSDDRAAQSGLVVATIYSFRALVDEAFLRFFDEEALPLLSSAGTKVVGRYATEPSTTPPSRLPVREGEHMFVWFASYASGEQLAIADGKLQALSRWKQKVIPTIESLAKTAPERLILAPTPKSRLR